MAVMNYSFDPCGAIDSLNLDNPDNLKKILQRDKHTRVEGICAEAVFFRDLLSESFPIFSTGWWFRTRNNQFRVAKIVPEVQGLSELDFELLTFFSAKGVPTVVVSFDEKEKDFFYLRVDSRSVGDFSSQWHNKRQIFPRYSKVAPLPHRNTRRPD